MIGDVGDLKLLNRQRQHPRDIERNVAVADHDRALARQVEVHVGVIGVAVVPGDELRRRLAAGQILTGYPQPPVTRSSDRVQHRVVGGGQLLMAHVDADLDVAVETEAGRRAVFSNTRVTDLIFG